MLAQVIISVIVILVMMHAILGATAYLILLERKVASWAQDRTGPNRTNFSFGLYDIWDKIGLGWLFRNYRMLGLGQALADGLKLLFKEDYIPPNVNKALFILAPMLAVIPAMIGWAVIPWGGLLALPDINVFGLFTIDKAVVTIAVAPLSLGLVYLLAVGSLGVYGVTLAGYASNNKYSFFGSVRATAQMLSYEIPQGLSVLIMILVFATADATLMVDLQSGHTWGIFLHPVLAFIFFTCVLAECNRAPFDLAEAEQELVGGFHTEYSSMKWALFFLGEYMHMITGAAFFTILFLGGWSLNPLTFLPFLNGFEIPVVADASSGGILEIITAIVIVLVKMLIFMAKVAFLLFVMMWVRWTLPRLRFDQLMTLAWRQMIPVCLGILTATGLIIYFKLPIWWYPVANIGILGLAMIVDPMIPAGPQANRRVPLEGSRFCPPEVEAETA